MNKKLWIQQQEKECLKRFLNKDLEVSLNRKEDKQINNKKL